MKVLDWFKQHGVNVTEGDMTSDSFLRNAQTLEESSTSFMMANADREIIYANKAVMTLLRDVEEEIKKTLPQFNANNLIGQNIDIFHKNPSHQRGVLASLDRVMASSISIGKLNFKLTLMPLTNKDGVNIGTAVEWLDQTELLIKSGMLDALDRSQAIVEFDPDGVIKSANDNFLEVMGYSLDEVKGKHHSMFVDEDYKKSREYKDFWQALGEGSFQSGEYKRFAKKDREVWLQASYNPIKDPNGRVIGVVKYAIETTEQRLKNADFEGQIAAIGKSQAVIEFDMDGIILDANDNFLNAMGYSLNEVKGKHHSMFVESSFRSSHEYRQFWEDLNQGTFSTGEYLRIGKGGKDVWIQASYNPIMDLNGNPFKVVKYATDITGRKFAINEIKRVLMALSEGDLTSRVEQEFEGEFQQLSSALNTFIGDLSSMIGEISTASETINTASAEIAQGNADLSSRTEEQASSLEETASSMEELTGTVRLNSENANQANGLASQASKIAVEGGGLIEEVVGTMSAINESARKISDIIGVIDGIAFQTNILALNAAVEAARAGEQGRGFAVVASEVRSLAQRSADAAKDIKALISDSVSKIKDGNELVNKSGETMQEIVTAIKRVNDIMSEIAAASAEQASGIDEVGKAVTQMDEVTQQNAALVEEAAAAAESMKSQADNMVKQISVFKLEEGAEQPATVGRIASSSAKPKVIEQKSRPVAKRKPNVQPSTPEEDEWETF